MPPLSMQELEIQWFSILNSFVVVLVLTGFLMFLLRRILHQDYTRFDSDLEDVAEGALCLYLSYFLFSSSC